MAIMSFKEWLKNQSEQLELSMCEARAVHVELKDEKEFLSVIKSFLNKQSNPSKAIRELLPTFKTIYELLGNPVKYVSDGSSYVKLSDTVFDVERNWGRPSSYGPPKNFKYYLTYSDARVKDKLVGVSNVVFKNKSQLLDPRGKDKNVGPNMSLATQFPGLSGHTSWGR